MRKITINDVAALAGVSKTTVSRVLNGVDLVNHKTKQRVENAIAKLDYKPNELAKGLRNNKTKTIGVVVSNILNPFFTNLVRGIEDVAQNYNYNIILCNTDEQLEKEKMYLDMLLSKNIDGLIIASTGKMEDYTIIKKSLPVVFVDRRPEKGIKNKFDIVLVDNINGSAEVVEHLIDSGYRRIGIIVGSSESTTGYERLLGYKKALNNRGIDENKNYIKIGDFLGDKSKEHAMELLLESKCDAIFATNNMILLGVLAVVKELGFKMPHEVGLASFDDMEWMEYTEPRITAVAQPTYQIGSTAMTILLDRLSNKVKKDPEEIILPVALKVRESTIK